jgi:hypothetical protein
VRTACLGLAVGAFLWSVIIFVLLSLGVREKLDAIGTGLLAYMAVLAVGGLVSAVLLWKRVPLARLPAACCAVGFLLFVPLGTIVGAIILSTLFTEETERYLE